MFSSYLIVGSLARFVDHVVTSFLHSISESKRRKQDDV